MSTVALVGGGLDRGALAEWEQWLRLVSETGLGGAEQLVIELFDGNGVVEESTRYPDRDFPIAVNDDHSRAIGRLAHMG